MQKGAPLNIPLTVDLHIESFSGGTITQIESGATNVVYGQYGDGRWYATQRPGVNQFEDASVTVSDARGRSCYYWDAVSDKYIVNAGKVYKGSYSGTSMNITTGTQRIFMGEVGNYLVILDHENNEGWTINSSSSTTITQINDSDFTALTLARGGCVLNGKIYVLAKNADIVESDIEDPTSWNPLNVRNAEVEPDNGVYIGKHHEHVVVIGTRSTEFFQDTGNPTASTLTARTDIHYSIGMVDADACWQVGDNLYFVGQDRSGAIGVYVLDNFDMRKISKESLDTFLTTAVTRDNVGITLCGMMSGGRSFLTLTLHNTITDLIPTQTIVFSSLRGWWGFWDVELPDVDYFPLVAWAPANSTRAGEGILINGDLVTMLDDFNPVDSVSASSVFESGVFESGVFTATSASGTSIPVEVVTGVIDGGTSRRKFQGDLWLIHTPTDVSEDITISTADEQNTSYEEAGVIDISDSEARLNRMGAFRRRNFKLTGSPTKQLRAEKIQTTLRVR